MDSAVARTLTRNVLSSWGGRIAGLAIAFLLTPYTLAKLGDAQFGLWAIVTSLGGFYGVLDLGFRSGLTRFISAHHAKQDFLALNRTANTGIVVLCCLSVLTWIATVVIAWVAAYWICPQGIDATTTFWTIIVSGFSIGLQFPFFVQSAVFVALQRLDLTNALAVAFRIIQAVLTVVALEYRTGLVGVAVATAVSDAAAYQVRFYLARRLLPELKLSPRLFCRDSFREFAGFSGWITVNRLSRSAIDSCERYIVGAILSLSYVTPFQLGYTLTAQYRQIFQPFSSTMFPALVRAHVLGDIATFQNLYLRSTRVVVSLAVPIALIGWFWAPEFFDLWISRPRRADMPLQPASLFRVLIMTQLIRVPQLVGNQTFLASSSLRQLSFAFLAEAVLAITASLLLITTMGAVGVAWGAFIATFVMQGIVVPSMTLRITKVSRTMYAINVLLPAGVMITVCSVSFSLLKHLLPADSWSGLALTGLVAGALSMLAAIFLVLDQAERQKLIAAPIRRRLGLKANS